MFIKGNNVIAGTSAKKAPTKIETVKHALFIEEKENKEMIAAFNKYNISTLLILGTSDGMVEKIATNLGLPKISKTIYIKDVATEEEMGEKPYNVRIVVTGVQSIETAKRNILIESRHEENSGRE